MNNYQEEFIKKQERSLATFIGDSSLLFETDSQIEKMKLAPREGKIYLPLILTSDQDDAIAFLWKLYQELALYDEWKNETTHHMGRKENWKNEIDHMVQFIRDQAEAKGGDLEVLNKKLLKKYVEKEIFSLLHKLDDYYSWLKVREKCPFFQNQENYRSLVASYEAEKRNKRYKGWTILGQPGPDFMEKLLIRQIIEKKGLEARDQAIKSFLYPAYKRSWQEKIRQMDFSSPSAGQDSLTGELEKGEDSDESRDPMALDPEEIEKILEEMAQSQEDREGGQGSKGMKLDLSPYGVGQKDQEIFDYYARLMAQEREEMKIFWQKILGQIRKEENVDADREKKGKLDVNSLIRSYPDYLEAEKKGTYKDLSIFKRQNLEPTRKNLPEKIEISFLVDNSGSMDPAKLDAAKKTLAVTLLSIEDFQNYLNQQGGSQGIPLKVQTESWLFGTGYQKIKSFDDRDSQSQNKANIIKTISRLDGQGGSTDDASCLEEIDQTIDRKRERDIKEGRLVKMIFEITDGAPNLPGSSKKMVDKLKAKGVDLYAFQIGKNSERSQKTFQFVWNEGRQGKMGIEIGQNIEKLAPELLKTLLKNMEKAIRKS